MELQTIFNQACQHLVRQGEAAVIKGDDGELSCTYRNDHGTRCAVGYLISDENYTFLLENQTADDEDVLNSVVSTIGELSLAGVRLLRELQLCHDNELLNHGLPKWAQSMIKLAEVRGLIVPKQVRELARG